MTGPQTEALAAALARPRETEHRGKNTLQLISSIVMLQGRRAGDPAARAALKAVLQRVNAVGSAHRHVIHTDDAENAELPPLLREVTADLAASAGREGIAIDLDLDPIAAPARHGAPVAL